MAHFVTRMIQTTRDEESQQLMTVWPDIIHDVTKAIENFNIPDVAKWMEKVLQYNVPGGKKIRGLGLIYAYKLLAPNDQLTEENIRLARILAWCVELTQTYFLMMDDIEDQSLFRRGQLCWYQYNDLNLAAINDTFMLQNSVFYLIRKHFKGKDCYVNLLEIFQDITMKSTMGQSLELLCSNFGKKPNLDIFTMDRYNSIIEYKTAYYTYVFPITAAMHLAGIKDQEMFKEAKTISLELGCFFQVQDDYVDLFGKFDVCGKDGTDIQEGKCTWFVVVALQRVTPEQRKILEECYGDSDLEKIQHVKQLYNDLNLLDAYFKYEEETYNLIKVHIKQISSGLPHNLFLDILENLCHRVS
ncbi:PREDICTED: farnesyl pyrophosphate synthase-like [Cyphomyrmex costatus]|uniref:Farnesyl pyrophosphate synthase n=1 Tax=Cyphomyrmex costatus TaxID=456900 RepID=A0A195C3Y5_9HYME|nr:PREDICTED: farnesyl pyrophosphate synthase-like [Cyphomyrmex costatus]KYM94888.1 Farnesyl pyrophosphate synthase [Cyphomyrmex costatus]